MSAGAHEIRGRIRWYDRSRGFGFADLDSEPGSCFLHGSAFVDGVCPGVKRGAPVLARLSSTRLGATAEASEVRLDLTASVPEVDTEVLLQEQLEATIRSLLPSLASCGADFGVAAERLCQVADKMSHRRAFVGGAVYDAVQHAQRHAMSSAEFLRCSGEALRALLQRALRSGWAFTPEQRKSLESMVSAVELLGGMAPLPSPGTLVQSEAQQLERVLSGRTSRFVLVLDGLADASNIAGILRTADALGVAHVWIVPPAKLKLPTSVATRSLHAVSKRCERWLLLRRFRSAGACLQALRADGREIWSSALHDARAEPLGASALEGGVPRRFALVVGSEREGVSETMLNAARRVVYLPMCGIVESLNVAVATALLLQRLLDACPDAHGDLSEEEKTALRAQVSCLSEGS